MPNVLHPFRHKNPRARIPETPFPEPYIFNDTENIFVDDILALFNKNGLMLHQSIDLLERSGRSERIDEMEQRLAKRTTD
ncbi:MAG TPA: hypothetical protein VLL06_00880 [Nitrospiraceae bacterium]|nr:hypothetical protein [Nitrospiraceae bacterium]